MVIFYDLLLDKSHFITGPLAHEAVRQKRIRTGQREPWISVPKKPLIMRCAAAEIVPVYPTGADLSTTATGNIPVLGIAGQFTLHSPKDLFGWRIDCTEAKPAGGYSYGFPPRAQIWFCIEAF